MLHRVVVNLVEGTESLEVAVCLNNILDLVQVPLQTKIGGETGGQDGDYSGRDHYKHYLVNLGKVMNPVNRVILLVHSISNSE